MTNKEKMDRVGLNHRYLDTARGEKLEYIKSLDKDIGIAFKKYIDEANETSDALLSIYYELKEKNGCLYSFSKHLRKVGLCGHNRCFYTMIGQLTVNYDFKTASIKKIQKTKKILEEYKKFTKSCCS